MSSTMVLVPRDRLELIMRALGPVKGGGEESKRGLLAYLLAYECLAVRRPPWLAYWWPRERIEWLRKELEL